MVELQRFFAVVRSQGVDGVRQSGQGVFHECPLLKKSLKEEASARL
jgi:hypothetical protein